MKTHKNILDGIEILRVLGMPRAQLNDRSALCLLAICNLVPGKTWAEVERPLVGITPIMDWARKFYKKKYAPNTRETIRRQTMHQFVEAGIALYNPDQPTRPVNSPKAVYQLGVDTWELLKSFQTTKWNKSLKSFSSQQTSLSAKYAHERSFNQIPVKISPNTEIQLSPGAHSELIKAIIHDFAPRFVPGGELIYVGDTGNKWGYFDKLALKKLGVEVDTHGKMPDVVIYFPEKKWLLLIESVTSHGPVDGKRHQELAHLFGESNVGIVYVTAFPSKNIMAKYVGEIAWETEVWVSDAPSHLIHFNGIRFLGPYSDVKT
jgi:BsuBI/PstI restriction endonuclease domain/BsuBI/PstI restriction endonuclease HTH domain